MKYPKAISVNQTRDAEPFFSHFIDILTYKMHRSGKILNISNFKPTRDH